MAMAPFDSHPLFRCPSSNSSQCKPPPSQQSTTSTSWQKWRRSTIVFNHSPIKTKLPTDLPNLPPQINHDQPKQNTRSPHNNLPLNRKHIACKPIHHLPNQRPRREPKPRRRLIVFLLHRAILRSAAPQTLHSISDIFRCSPVDCYVPKQPHCNYQLHPTPQPTLALLDGIAWPSQAMRAAIKVRSERMEAAFQSLRKSSYKMYDSLHKNHLPNEHHCSLIGYKYMNLLLRHLCARQLEGKNQS